MTNTIAKALERLMPLGGWSLNGELITIHEDGYAHGYNEPTTEEVAAAIAEIENEAYREKRAQAYPSIGDQLDALWKELMPQTVEAQQMKSKILQVKADYPKPAEE